MPIMTRPGSGPAAAVLYITVGALLGVWSGIWYWYLKDNYPEGSSQYYLCTGIFLTGLVLVTIGLVFGQIGRAARESELPPKEAIGDVARAEKDAAKAGAVVTDVTPGVPPVDRAVPPTAPLVPGAAPVSAPTAPVVSRPQNR